MFCLFQPCLLFLVHSVFIYTRGFLEMHLLKGIGFNFRNIVCDVKRHESKCVIGMLLTVKLIHDACIVNRKEQARTIDLTTIQFTNAWLADSLNDFVLNLTWTKPRTSLCQFNPKPEMNLNMFFLSLFVLKNCRCRLSSQQPL